MNNLRWAWERYRLLVFLVVAVYVVVVVVSPLTGCAAAPRRTSSTPQRVAAPDISDAGSLTAPTLNLPWLTPVLGLMGASALYIKRQHEYRTNP